MDGGHDSYPNDKILCEGRFTRYVVACMRNCPNRQHCREFWAFFEERGITPVEYSNRNGIGESVMKRIVFDCDRCGKKDIGEPLSAYHTAGEAEGQPLQAADFAALAGRYGPLHCSEQFLGGVLHLLKDELAWEHYCEPCFRKVVAGAGTIVGRTSKATPATVSAQTPLAQALAARRAPQIPILRIEEDDPEPAEKPSPRGRPARRG